MATKTKPTIKFGPSAYQAHEALCRDCQWSFTEPECKELQVRKAARKHAIATGHVVKAGKMQYFCVTVLYPSHEESDEPFVYVADCHECEATILEVDHPTVEAFEHLERGSRTWAEALVIAHQAATGHDVSVGTWHEIPE